MPNDQADRLGRQTVTLTSGLLLGGRSAGNVEKFETLPVGTKPKDITPLITWKREV